MVTMISIGFAPSLSCSCSSCSSFHLLLPPPLPLICPGEQVAATALIAQPITNTAFLSVVTAAEQVFSRHIYDMQQSRCSHIHTDQGRVPTPTTRPRTCPRAHGLFPTPLISPSSQLSPPNSNPQLPTTKVMGAAKRKLNAELWNTLTSSWMFWSPTNFLTWYDGQLWIYR